MKDIGPSPKRRSDVSLPAKLTIHECAIALDGGTKYLMAKDETGREHTIKLTQHAFPRVDRSTGELPGRLHFDGQLVPMRSEVEARILSLLKTAEVHDDISSASAAEIVRYVESDHYLSFADRVEQAVDDTRYDVWVAWDAGEFSRAVLLTKQVLGIGLREARDAVEQDKPIASALTALEVADLAARCRSGGLGVRVSPEFRWLLR
jgi:hypothetical protein